MTHFDIITKAYDECGIVYAVKNGDDGWRFLFLAGTEARKQEIETMPLDDATRQFDFMEFEADGRIASY